MVDYAAAIKKPFEDMQTAGIGIIIGFIPVLNFLVSGYAMGVGRKVINGNNALPKWDPNQIIPYIKDLIFGMIIGVVYLIPAGVLFLIGGAVALGSILAAFSGGDPSLAAGSVIGIIAAGGIFLLIGAILAIVGGLMASMGIFFYLKEGSLGAAFKFGAILKKILTVQYLATLVISVIYSFVLMVIMGLLSIIPILGSLVGIGLMTYAGAVTSYTMFAEVFKETP